MWGCGGRGGALPCWRSDESALPRRAAASAGTGGWLAGASGAAAAKAGQDGAGIADDVDGAGAGADACEGRGGKGGGEGGAAGDWVGDGGGLRECGRKAVAIAFGTELGLGGLGEIGVVAKWFIACLAG